MPMRRFVLVRSEDVTGRSGLGIIAEGCAWTGGSAHLHWMTDWETFVHWPGGIDAVLAVHGHEGKTVVRWLDDAPPPPTSEASKYIHDRVHDPRD
jgi:hypothetical protein